MRERPSSILARLRPLLLLVGLTATPLFRTEAHEHGDGADTRTEAATPAPDQFEEGFSFSIRDSLQRTGVVLQGIIGEPDAEQRLAGLLDPKALSWRAIDQVRSVADQVLGSTPWAGSVRVNEPPRRDHINIYVLTHDHLQRRRPELACGCSFIPGTGSIVCDARFLEAAETFLDVHTADALTAPEAQERDVHEAVLGVRQLFRSFILEWVVAHELGHLVKNHDRASLARTWSYRNGRGIGLDVEREADEFYIEHLSHASRSQAAAYFGLSQFITNLYSRAILSQYTKEQLEKQEGDWVFSTSLDVTIPYDPRRHPPMLLRALNLVNLLLGKYPNLVDGSDYFSRVAHRLKLVESARSADPALCSPPPSGALPPTNKVSLAQHLELLLNEEGTSLWAAAALEELRSVARSAEQPDVRNAWEASADIFGARLRAQRDGSAPDFTALRSAANRLDGFWPLVLDVQLAVAQARAGQTAREDDLRRTLTQAEDAIGQLTARNVLDAADPSDAFDIASTYLDILLTRGAANPSDLADRENAEFRKLLQAVRQGNLDGARREATMRLLARSFQMAVDAHKAGSSRSMLEPALERAYRVVLYADANGWLQHAIAYATVELDLLGKLDPPPHPVLANRKLALARALTVREAASKEVSVRLAREAVEHIRSIEAVQAAAGHVEASVRVWRLSAQNSLSWHLLLGGKHEEALSLLATVRQGLEQERGSQTRCMRNSGIDRELAAVDHNRADILLTIGNFPEALQAARESRLCREQAGNAEKALEVSKSEGYALYFMGQKEEARSRLQAYLNGLALVMDDNLFTDRHQSLRAAVVNHRPVPILELFPDLAPQPNPSHPRPVPLLDPNGRAEQ